jgi:hypothetical protein
MVRFYGRAGRAKAIIALSIVLSACTHKEDCSGVDETAGCQEICQMPEGGLQVYMTADPSGYIDPTEANGRYTIEIISMGTTVTAEMKTNDCQYGIDRNDRVIKISGASIGQRMDITVGEGWYCTIASAVMDSGTDTAMSGLATDCYGRGNLVSVSQGTTAETTIPVLCNKKTYDDSGSDSSG